MASNNPDSTINQGEFSARKPRAPPMDTHGHQPGYKSSPNDSLPTFAAQTLTPGTAPPDKTYAPQNQQTSEGLETNIDPLEGMVGATSQGLHRGLGKPVQGMASEEVRHSGQQGRKREAVGLAKHGAGGEAQGVNERVDEGLRGVEREEARPRRGDKGSRPAEDLPSTGVSGKRP